MATKLLKTDGKYNWRRIAAAIMVPIVIFVLTTAYGRYSWMRDQCYKVATHELALIQTKEALITKDAFLEALINKNNGILHSRDSKETDKREKGDERLMDLFLKVLDSQQQSLKHQQDQLEKKAK
jgi:hypothetical protein